MVCPVCGADRDGMEVCPKCGWEFQSSAEESIPDPPVDRCEGIDGYLVVGYFSVTIHKVIHERVVEREIAYRDIRDVVFREGSEQECGFLGIRSREDPLPPVATELDAVCDETALIFDAKMDDVFRGAYDHIEKLVRILGTDRSFRRERDEIFCPKCKSSRYTVEQKTHRRLRGRSKSFMIALIYAVFWLYAIRSGMMTEYVCLECGNRWFIRTKDKKREQVQDLSDG